MQIKQALKQILGTETYSVINFNTFNLTPNKSFDCASSKAIQHADDIYTTTLHKKVDENGLPYFKKTLASVDGKKSFKIYRDYTNASAFDLVDQIFIEAA